MGELIFSSAKPTLIPRGCDPFCKHQESWPLETRMGHAHYTQGNDCPLFCIHFAHKKEKQKKTRKKTIIETAHSPKSRRVLSLFVRQALKALLYTVLKPFLLMWNELPFIFLHNSLLLNKLRENRITCFQIRNYNCTLEVSNIDLPALLCL